MYDKKFTEIYKNSGWELFSDVFGKFMLNYFNKKEISVKSNLDLACGTGYLCNLFAENGIASLGVDISKSMIECAKEYYPKTEFVLADIIDYKGKTKVDLVTCICDSLNHMTSITNVQNAVGTAFSNLNDGGYFIFDIINTRKIKLGKEYSFLTDIGEISYSFEFREPNDLITNVIVIDQNEKTFKKQIKEIAINKHEMDSILHDVGFKIVKVMKKISASETELTLKWFYICKKELPKEKVVKGKKNA